MATYASSTSPFPQVEAHPIDGSMLAVKSDLNGDLRRFESPSDLHRLLVLIGQVYNLQPNSFSVTYRDDEGDMITLLTQSDLSLATRVGGPVLRLRIQPRALAVEQIPTSNISVPYILRGKQVTLQINASNLKKNNMDHLTASELEQLIAKIKFKKLIRMGLVDFDFAQALCIENDIRPFGCPKPEKFSMHKEKDLNQELRGHPHHRGHHHPRHGPHHPHHGHPHHGPHPHFHPHGVHPVPPCGPTEPVPFPPLTSIGEGEDEKATGDHARHHPQYDFRGRGSFGRGFGRGRGRGREPLTVFPSPTQEPNNETPEEESDATESHKKKGGRKLLARFVKHVTFPDNTAVGPGVLIEKVWRFRNDSQQPWPSKCELIRSGGDGLKIADACHVRGDIAPNQEVDVTLKLIAPTKPGFYQSFYRLREVDGKKFGQRVWIAVTVHASSASESSSSSQEDSDTFVSVDKEMTEIQAPKPNVTFDTDIYAVALQQLAGMGFCDKTTNVQLLVRYRGNVERVVARLHGDDV